MTQDASPNNAKVRAVPKKLDPKFEPNRRLKKIFDEEKDRSGMTYVILGGLVGMGDKGVGAYMRSEIPINHQAAIKFAQALNCAVSDILPELAGAELQGEERDILTSFRDLTPENRRHALSLIRRLVDQQE